MSENRTYYVICDDNCRFEGMTKEQIIAAIAEATGVIPTGIDNAFITKIKELNHNANLSFWVGTQAEYNEIEEEERVKNCIYIITDDTSIEEMQARLDLMGVTVQNLQDELDKKGVVICNTPFITSTELNIEVEKLKNYSLVNVYGDFEDSEGLTKSFNALCQVVKFDVSGGETGFRIQGLCTPDHNFEYLVSIDINAYTENGKLVIKQATVLSKKLATLMSYFLNIKRIIGIM